MFPFKIMIVDDDENILFAFREVLKKDGYENIEARDGREALIKFESENPDIIFMDITMPELDGLEALKKIKEKNFSVPVIIITGRGTMQTAINAMQAGAFEYLTKPLSVTKVRDAIQKALSSLKSPVAEILHVEMTDRYELIGNSPALQEVYKLIGSISTTPNSTSVLITGETGTGKELVARAIHNNTINAQESFVAINGTAIPDTLLESELFGHEKGTFTGATEKKTGKFEIAKNGTIFLDEIGDVSFDLQKKLLRVIQEREFQRLGSNESIKVNARFIAATNHDLAKKVTESLFREDLYFRLNIVSIHMPPLREHKEDIKLLADYFLQRHTKKLKKNIKGFSEDIMKILSGYSYPGNVRELENLIERAVILTQGDIIIPEAFGELTSTQKQNLSSLPITSPVYSKAKDYIIELFEKQFISDQLKKNKGNVSAAAKKSNISRQYFHQLMQKHKISTEDPDHF